MATVTIGGRELAVWSRKEPGSLGKLKRAIVAERALQMCEVETMPDAIAGLVLVYVGHNEGVTQDWLLEQLPADASDVLRDCVAATRSTVGEAKGP